MSRDGAYRMIRNAAICVALAVAVFVLWKIRAAILLGFGAIMAAMLLRLVAAGLRRVTGLPDGLGLFAATAIILGALGACAWLFGANLATGLGNVVRQVEAGERYLRSALQGSGVGTTLIQQGTSIPGHILSSLLSLSLNFVENAIVLAIMAIYLAAQPGLYRRGAALLFPPHARASALEALDLIGFSLRLWLLGQFLLMLLVGVLSYAAMLLIGLPNALVLALIAGFVEIVPYLGPFIGVVPAVLVALTQGLEPAAWTLGAYLAIHLFEGYFVGPLLQRWFVRIPPALVLFSIVAFQLLFGIAGVVLAAPMAVAVFAAVKILYLRDTLGQSVVMPTKTPF